MVPDLVQKILKGQYPLRILGEGNKIRHYTYAGDLANGFYECIINPKALNDNFNISTPTGHTVLELAKIIWNKINPDKEFKYECDEAFTYDVQRRVPDVTKAKEILGVECNTLYKEIKHQMIKDLNNYQRINYFNNQKNDDFTKIVLNIKYINNLCSFINYKFVVIHHRNKIDNCWNKNMQQLQQMIDIIICKYKIIIFSNETIELEKNNNIYIINNLNEYASYMNHNNCVALIFVWSGDGQLGFYCCNSKVIQYFHPIQLPVVLDENDKIDKFWLESQMYLIL